MLHDCIHRDASLTRRTLKVVPLWVTQCHYTVDLELDTKSLASLMSVQTCICISPRATRAVGKSRQLVGWRNTTSDRTKARS